MAFQEYEILQEFVEAANTTFDQTSWTEGYIYLKYLESQLANRLRKAEPWSKRLDRIRWKGYTDNPVIRERLRAAHRVYNTKHKERLNAERRKKYREDTEYRERVLASKKTEAKRLRDKERKRIRRRFDKMKRDE